MNDRDERGRYYKQYSSKKANKLKKRVCIDHNHSNTFNCNGKECLNSQCNADRHINLPKHVERSGWRNGRRIVELGYLLDQLKFCYE